MVQPWRRCHFLYAGREDSHELGELYGYVEKVALGRRLVPSKVEEVSSKQGFKTSFIVYVCIYIYVCVYV